MTAFTYTFALYENIKTLDTSLEVHAFFDLPIQFYIEE